MYKTHNIILTLSLRIKLSPQQLLESRCTRSCSMFRSSFSRETAVQSTANLHVKLGHRCWMRARGGNGGWIRRNLSSVLTFSFFESYLYPHICNFHQLWDEQAKREISSYLEITKKNRLYVSVWPRQPPNAWIGFHKFCTQVFRREISVRFVNDQNRFTRFKMVALLNTLRTICHERLIIFLTNHFSWNLVKNSHNLDMFCYFYSPIVTKWRPIREL